jgi:hypothetical protein
MFYKMLRAIKMTTTGLVVSALLFTSVISAAPAYGFTGPVSELGDVQYNNASSIRVRLKDNVALSAPVIIEAGDALEVLGAEAGSFTITAAPGHSVFAMKGNAVLTIGSMDGEYPAVFCGSSSSKKGYPAIDATSANGQGDLTVDKNIVLCGGNGSVPSEAILYPSSQISFAAHIAGVLKTGSVTVIEEPAKDPDPGNQGSAILPPADNGSSNDAVSDTGQTSDDIPDTTAPVSKGDRFKSGKLIYKVTSVSASGGSVTVLKTCRKTYKSVTIPSAVRYKNGRYKVKAISKNAFRKNKKLRRITVKGKAIKTTGKNAFRGIKRNTVVRVPKGKVKSYKKMFCRAGMPKTVKIIKLR